MGTRATYSFEHRYLDKLVTMYVHWDNYPKGAAVYFWNMHLGMNKYKGHFAEVFIKANGGTVEFSEGHDHHWDTEYQYHLDKHGILTAKEISLDKSRETTIIFEGHYAEFINLYHEYLKEVCENFEKLLLISKTADPYRRKPYMTLSEVKEHISGLHFHVLSGHKHDKEILQNWEEEFKRLHKLVVSQQ
jgi:hypothetical protein